MGTDVTERRRPCRCGQGTILITASAPDHPWARESQTSYDFEIECATCAERLALDGSILVDRAEREAELAARAAYEVAAQRFDTSADMAELRERFEAHLNSLETVAEAYRCLKATGMETCTIGTFRKRWKHAEAWAYARRVSHWNVTKVLTVLGEPAEHFADGLHELQQLHAAIPKPRAILNCLR